MFEPFREGLNKLVLLYIGMFQKDSESTMRMFANLNSPLQIMNTFYGYSVQAKEIEKIEDLSDEIKHKLWNQAKAYGVISNKKSIMLCRCIWVINFILEK